MDLYYEGIQKGTEDLQHFFYKKMLNKSLSIN